MSTDTSALRAELEQLYASPFHKRAAGLLAEVIAAGLDQGPLAVDLRFRLQSPTPPQAVEVSNALSAIAWGAVANQRALASLSNAVHAAVRAQQTAAGLDILDAWAQQGRARRYTAQLANTRRKGRWYANVRIFAAGRYSDHYGGGHKRAALAIAVESAVLDLGRWVPLVEAGLTAAALPTPEAPPGYPARGAYL